MKLGITERLFVDRFISLISNLKHLTQDVLFRCSPERLYIQEFDDSRICIVEANLNKEWFDIYKCEEEEEIGINAELSIILTKCFNKDLLRLYLETNDTEPDKLIILWKEKLIQILKDFPCLVWILILNRLKFLQCWLMLK